MICKTGGHKSIRQTKSLKARPAQLYSGVHYQDGQSVTHFMEELVVAASLTGPPLDPDLYAPWVELAMDGGCFRRCLQGSATCSTGVVPRTPSASFWDAVRSTPACGAYDGTTFLCFSRGWELGDGGPPGVRC